MKRILGFVILVSTVVVSGCNPGPVPEEPLRILYIGNSFTFFNDMPGIFSDLAESGGYEVDVTTLAKGGYSLADHAQDAETRTILESQKWDFVILQEKSDIPALVADREELMYPSVRQLNQTINEMGGKTILFMSWAYRDGFSEAGFPDHSAMQKEVATGYFTIADELDLLVAHVGLAWQNALVGDPNLNLWMPDGKHPTPIGSFLAAAVFYALIFNDRPADLIYSFGIYSDDEVFYLLQIAGETVLSDSEN